MCAICEMALFVPLTTLKVPKKVYVEPNLFEITKNLVSKVPDIDVEVSLSDEIGFDVVVSLESKDYIKALSMVSNEGVVILRLESWSIGVDENIKLMHAIRDSFEILMPYSSCFGSEINLLFASKKYHPTADMILQRADFIESNYYTPMLHKASFVLPQWLKKRLLGVAKN